MSNWHHTTLFYGRQMLTRSRSWKRILVPAQRRELESLAIAANHPSPADVVDTLLGLLQCIKTTSFSPVFGRISSSYFFFGLSTFRFSFRLFNDSISAFGIQQGKASGHLHLAVLYDAWTVWDGFAHIINFFFRWYPICMPSIWRNDGMVISSCISFTFP